MKEIAPRIVIDKNTRFGRPVIKGTRIPVDLILGKLSGGMSFEELMEEYEVSREDILAALRYAAQVISHEEIKVM
ncbi:DUF433 domain-containing protein [Desulfoscipio geothermicus]|jgi:uncharacterized protein (DUF433 family)|uniref:Uncharacterized conserved protein, DUF433 family n=1 Tax=Desulfoscipio geothermicus DSM 3669 TaxID=1121426 RepID=A0A1I6ELD1_9FIRM|nr:DUF433 domain-containing protein [Desulfoscipio geothermicus]SFR18576.1 Uncharacterized conserved protein, DUF433 family [Desulfoscipio geothermicus DSM 3669]